MLLLFMSNYRCTMTDKKQQQYEIVTTMTTIQSNLHKLLCSRAHSVSRYNVVFYISKKTDILPIQSTIDLWNTATLNKFSI